MPHCDPETLALRALGEPISAEDQSHLASCSECSEDFETLRAVVETGRQVTADDVPVAPPDHVWTSIADTLHLDGPASTNARSRLEVASEPAVVVDPPVAEPIRRTSRRTVTLVGVAASVAGLVLGAVAVAVATRDEPGKVVASTTLEPVDGSTAHGTATLRSTSGGRLLDVDLSGLPPTDGYFEVWFMNAENGGAVSLGSLDPAQPTTFDVPAGLVVADFPYVDVSVEPLDGDPAHSSVSVARGPLTPG